MAVYTCHLLTGRVHGRPWVDGPCIRLPTWPLRLHDLAAVRTILSHIFHAYLQTAIYEFLVNIWRTAEFNFLIPIFLQGTIFRRFEDVFC